MPIAWPETLKRAIDAHEDDVTTIARKARVGRSTIYHYRAGTKEPVLEQVVKLAKALGVRTAYLASGEEPMSADAWSVGNRALYQIDGFERDWDVPSGKETKKAKRAFEKSFGREHRVRYGLLSPTVWVIFGNLLARVMGTYRKTRLDDVKDPNWRGAITGRLLDHCADLVLEVEREADYDKEPWSTRAWLVAIAGELERWEDGPVPPNPFGDR